MSGSIRSDESCFDVKTENKNTRKKRSYRRLEGHAEFVVFMANKVDVVTLVQIFQLLNNDESDV